MPIHCVCRLKSLIRDKCTVKLSKFRPNGARKADIKEFLSDSVIVICLIVLDIFYLGITSADKWDIRPVLFKWDGLIMAYKYLNYLEYFYIVSYVSLCNYVTPGQSQDCHRTIIISTDTHKMSGLGLMISGKNL